MNLRQKLINDLKILHTKSNIEKNILSQFENRIAQGNLIKLENFTDHICCFFVPLHMPSKSIYLVHHKKADDWIPPGGHIDQNELPPDTVRREFKEELSLTLTDEKLELFNISIKHIENNPRNTCKVHYDLWYTVCCKEKHRFVYSEKEFHTASWHHIDKTIGKSIFPHINDMYQKIKSHLMSTST